MLLHSLTHSGIGTCFLMGEVEIAHVYRGKKVRVSTAKHYAWIHSAIHFLNYNLTIKTVENNWPPVLYISTSDDINYIIDIFYTKMLGVGVGEGGWGCMPSGFLYLCDVGEGGWGCMPSGFLYLCDAGEGGWRCMPSGFLYPCDVGEWVGGTCPLGSCIYVTLSE